MREKGDVLRVICHDAQQLRLSMFLSEPGGVSGRRRISIRLTKFPETPPDTFGGFFVDIVSRIYRPPGCPEGLFCWNWVGSVVERPETHGPSRVAAFFWVSVMEDSMLKSISEGSR